MDWRLSTNILLLFVVQAVLSASIVQPSDEDTNDATEATVESVDEPVEAPFFYAKVQLKEDTEATTAKVVDEDDDADDYHDEETLAEIIKEIVATEDHEGFRPNWFHPPPSPLPLLPPIAYNEMHDLTPLPTLSRDFFNDDDEPLECPPCTCLNDDETLEEGFDFDPTLRYDSHPLRSRRSVGSDYWQSIGAPSKHLSANNVGYRIKNDLRKRLEREEPPLHYGHIYDSDHSKNPHDRTFGYDSDFNLYKDSHAFKHHPAGPRLGYSWIEHKWPIYAYNLYKLRENLWGYEIGYRGKGKPVWIKQGLYKFVALIDDDASMLIEEVKSGHRFFVERLFIDAKKSEKFQALLNIKDPQGRYISAHNPVFGKVHLIKGTPLTGHNPKTSHHLLYHGYSDFRHLSYDPYSLLGHGNDYRRRTFD